MTREELFETPQFLAVKDIERLYGCSRCKAYSIIRAIKSVSDRLHFAGRVTVSDYEAWYEAKTKAD